MEIKRKQISAKRITTVAILCALSSIMYCVESLFPPLFVPGAKMGLSNVFSLFALFALGTVDGITVAIVKTLVGSLLTGNMSSLVYSLSAALVSITLSTLLIRFAYPKISIVAISTTAAVVNNIVQNLVFCVMSNTPEMYVYMPYLALTGVLAGIIVGFAVYFALRVIPLSIFGASNKVDLTETKENAQK